jgi:glycosyltransferase involved in cell wall biosynthesis
MRIALVGHACSPYVGSEPGITWNWAIHLAALHEVTLLSHPQHRTDVETELAKLPLPNLKIQWITLPGWIDPWKPEKGERGLRLHYRFWQNAALRALRQLHATAPFDLVHHVSWGSLQQPSPAWKLGIPFVWGPVGGGQVWPAAFLGYAGAGAKTERFRRLMVRLTRFNLPVVRAARHADLILTINRETAKIVDGIGARRAEHLTDYGTKESWLSAPVTRQASAGRLSMLWGGRCEPRKGLPLVLEAMAKRNDPQIQLTVAGSGPSLEQWKQLASKLGVAERVSFLGQVPWARMGELFAGCDALIFPSLRDSQGTIVLEAMARGVPIIALDHQGVGTVVPADAGVKVAVTTPQQTIAGLAEAMRMLADDPERRLAMGRAAAAFSAEQTWEKRVARMSVWYEEVVHAHRHL